MVWVNGSEAAVKNIIALYALTKGTISTSKTPRLDSQVGGFDGLLSLCEMLLMRRSSVGPDPTAVDHSDSDSADACWSE